MLFLSPSQPWFLVRYLKLCDPGTVPVRHVGPLGKELPLRSPCQRGGVRSVGRKIRRSGDRRWRRRISPAPGEDLLDLPLHGRTLEEEEEEEKQIFIFQLLPECKPWAEVLKAPDVDPPCSADRSTLRWESRAAVG